jgi:hypothetical protein
VIEIKVAEPSAPENYKISFTIIVTINCPGTSEKAE